LSINALVLDTLGDLFKVQFKNNTFSAMVPPLAAIIPPLMLAHFLDIIPQHEMAKKWSLYSLEDSGNPTDNNN
jgi:hypothetical protein